MNTRFQHLSDGVTTSTWWLYMLVEVAYLAGLSSSNQVVQSRYIGTHQRVFCRGCACTRCTRCSSAVPLPRQSHLLGSISPFLSDVICEQPTTDNLNRLVVRRERPCNVSCGPILAIAGKFGVRNVVEVTSDLLGYCSASMRSRKGMIEMIALRRLVRLQPERMGVRCS